MEAAPLAPGGQQSAPSRLAAGRWDAGLATALSAPHFDRLLLLAIRNSFQLVQGKTISNLDLFPREKRETGEAQKGELEDLQVADFEVRMLAVVEAKAF